MFRFAFIGKLLLFLLPMLALFISPFFIAFYSGEALPPRLVYQTQASSPGAIYMTDHRQYTLLYKYFAFDTARPEVLFLGASRLETFRAGFLTRNPDAGYNAALTALGMPYIEAFIDHMTPENAPKVLLLQVDQFWFNRRWPEVVYTSANDIFAEIEPDRIVIQTRQVILDLLSGKVTLDQLLQRSYPRYPYLALGFHAMQHGNGYAADGGLHIYSRPLAPVEHTILLDNALKAMDLGITHYMRGDKVNREALEQLDRIIGKAEALGIQVIGIAPGYMPSVYAEMVMGGRHTYINKAMPRVAELFTKRGFHFFDFTDMSGFSHDNEMRDGDHPYEIAAAKMYLRMVEGAPELLGPYTDVEVLQSMIDNAPTVMEVVPIE